MASGESTCLVCGGPKFNFETHEQHVARIAETPMFRGVPVYTREDAAPRLDGMVPFGNRLTTLDQVGRNTFMRRR